ncbi:MAG: helicase-exonuclease AddAB subunit AddA [Clostridiales bacterium]|jgi:ATP-dependent helicase/nuclease subunit A|nr:helicase-exonuclease AddAB subunit AddA [Clostridiales bacterium]
MPRDYTAEQLDAINTRGRDILVSSAAGSGKTSVLVERVIRLITDERDPVDIDRLLVVTFTEAAANEMKARILRAVEDKLRADPYSERLLRQRALINTAPIATIHSFCRSVIRDYFYLIGVDPRFGVLDAARAEMLKGEVMTEVFEWLFAEGGEEIRRLSDCFGQAGDDGRLARAVLRIYEFSRSQPFPDEWLARAAEGGFEGTEWHGFFVSQARRTLSRVAEAADRALELSASPGINPKAAETLRADKLNAEAALSALDSGFGEFCRAARFDYQTLSVAVRRKKNDPEDPDEVLKLRERIKSIREDEIKKPFAALRDKAQLSLPPELLAEHVALAAKDAAALVALVREFAAAYDAAKRAKNAADFSDLEHLCLRALLAEGSSAERPILSEAALALRERFAETIMDEYQDANAVQETIIAAVSGGDRFMVGDIKQSIYRFRSANPDLFRAKYEEYARGGAGKLITLPKNFRSRASVIDAINGIFGLIMSEELGEIDYDERHMLRHGLTYPGDDHPAEIIVVPADAGDEDDPFAEATAAEREAMAVAGRIAELLRERFPVSDGAGGLRPIRPGDIAILLRAKAGIAETFRQVLADAGIPALADTDDGFLDKYEVMVVTSLLNVIDNPRQDIPLAALMLSPVGGFSPEESALIRAARRGGLLIDAAAAYTLGQSGDLADRLSAFLARIERWRDMAVFTPIAELIKALLAETRFDEYAAGQRGGAGRLANLSALIERAAEFEREGRGSLFRFTDYIDRVRRGGKSFAEARAPGESDDMVRIMTIHKSKGLEFPVVFVSGMGRRFNLRDASEPILCHQSLGIAPVYVDTAERVRYNTLKRFAAGEKITEESLSEEARVLYVAATRAREKLIFTGALADCEKRSETIRNMPESALASSRCFLDWILYAAQRSDLFDIRVAEPSAPDAVSVTDTPETRESAAPAETAYAHDAAARIPSKVSITEIKRLRYESALTDSAEPPSDFAGSTRNHLNFAGFTRNYPNERPGGCPAPRFARGAADRLSPTREGTLIHAVLERIDFARDRSYADVTRLIARLAEEDVIPRGEAWLIDAGIVARFLTSDVARRIRESSDVRREAPFVLGVPPSFVTPDWAGADDERVLVHGIIDCLFLEPDGWTLLDYKTDRAASDSAHRAQMEIYRRAFETASGLSVKRSLIYFLRSGECREV